MSYELEELRDGILDLFDDAAGLSARAEEFGVLRPIRGTPIVIKVPRRTRTGLTRGINSLRSWRKQIATAIRQGHRVCFVCGARSATHRCPG